MKKAAIGVYNGNWKNQWNRREPQSSPLPFERDANAIYQALVNQAGLDVAKARAFFLLGSSYDDLCAGLLVTYRATGGTDGLETD